MEVKTRNGNRFYCIDGAEYPSVTTILGILRKPWLEQWRGKLGNAEADRVRDDAADIGTQLHRVCHLFNSRQPFTLPNSQIERMFGAYFTWFHCTVQEVLATEVQCWSVKYGYAGTFDLLAILKGDSVPSVIDLKSSNDFSPEMALQLSAYREAILERVKQVNRRLVVRIDKVKQGKLEVKEYTEHHRDFGAFLNVLGLWRWYNR